MDHPAEPAQGELLRRLIDGLGPSMFVGLLTPDGRILEANRPAMEAFGLTREAVLGQRFEDLRPWAWSAVVQQQLRDALARAARGEPSRYDVELMVDERTFAIVDFSLQPLVDASGLVTCIVPSAIDVSRRKRAEQTARASEMRLARILETIPSGVIFIEPTGEISFANAAAERISGFTSAGVVGRALNEVVTEVVTPGGRVLPADERPFAVVMRTGRPVEGIELAIERADGERAVVLANAAPMHESDGSLTGVVAGFSDITDRRRAEETLRENEERLRLALEAAHTGTFDWDMRSNRITWSPGHERLWAYEPGQFPGTYEAFATRVHPEDLPHIEAEVRRCAAAHQQMVAEMRVLWPDGSVHWVNGRGDFVFDRDGQPIRMRGVVVEITSQKRTEEALRKSERQLRRALDQVHTAREEESARIARELHDGLGQALTGLRIDLSWIDRHLAGIGSPAGADVHAKVLAMMEEIDDTIRMVRRISTDLRPQLLDDLGLAAAIEWQAREFETRTGISCSATIGIADRAVEPRRATALFRILLEALTNVVRHAGARRVDVTLAADDDGTLCLDVRDDGRGFDPDHLSSPGALGLFGMQERAQVFGGQVEISRRDGGGTLVRARIPAA